MLSDEYDNFATKTSLISNLGKFFDLRFINYHDFDDKNLTNCDGYYFHEIDTKILDKEVDDTTSFHNNILGMKLYLQLKSLSKRVLASEMFFSFEEKEGVFMFGNFSQLPEKFKKFFI